MDSPGSLAWHGDERTHTTPLKTSSPKHCTRVSSVIVSGRKSRASEDKSVMSYRTHLRFVFLFLFFFAFVPFVYRNQRSRSFDVELRLVDVHQRGVSVQQHLRGVVQQDDKEEVQGGRARRGPSGRSSGNSKKWSSLRLYCSGGENHYFCFMYSIKSSVLGRLVV